MKRNINILVLILIILHTLEKYFRGLIHVFMYCTTLESGNLIDEELN